MQCFELLNMMHWQISRNAGCFFFVLKQYFHCFKLAIENIYRHKHPNKQNIWENTLKIIICYKYVNYL